MSLVLISLASGGGTFLTFVPIASTLIRFMTMLFYYYYYFFIKITCNGFVKLFLNALKNMRNDIKKLK